MLEESEHHPAQERAVLSTMVCLVRTKCDTESPKEEMQHLKTFKHNGYSDQDISQALKPKNRQGSKQTKLQIKKFLPFHHTSSYKISRLLAKHVRTIHVPGKKTIHTLWSLKDSWDLTILCLLCTMWLQYGICWADQRKHRNQVQGTHVAPLPWATR